MPSTSKSSRPTRNWLDLPSDVTTNILSRVGVHNIFENVQKVCTAWYEICKDPTMWRVICVDHINFTFKGENLWTGKALLKPEALFKGEALYKQVVDRSRGQLIDITIENFWDDEFLQYVADRSSQLRRLTIVFCYEYTFTDGTWTEALKKFPLLEELSLYSTKVSKEVIETTGRYCPKLKTLKLNHGACPFFEEPVANRDNVAIAIGEKLHKLEHLELIGNCMSNIGLKVILKGCRRLKSLDLRACSNIDLKGAVGKRCLEQIKCVKLPDDALEDCPYIYDNLEEFSNHEYLDRGDEYDEYLDHDDEHDEYFDHDAEYDNFTEHNDEYDEFDGYFNELLTSMGLLE